jgi:hypothetical protein
MHARTLLVWIAVGLVGLALAAGVTYAATQLSSQRIGLSAEPPSAGQELAPRKTPTTTQRSTNATGSGRQASAGGSSGGDHEHQRQPPQQQGRGAHNGALDD